MGLGLKFIMSGLAKNGSQQNLINSLNETYTASEGQTAFVLEGTYRVGTNELNVYVNGVRKVLGIDYLEVDAKTVRFLTPLKLGDIAHFSILSVDTTTTSIHEEFVATANQTEFVLSKIYRLGSNTLQVYYNGLLVRLGEDYREIDNRTIRFLMPLPAGSKITFKETV